MTTHKKKVYSLFVYWYTMACVCEVRGQLAGADSLLPPSGPWESDSGGPA